MRKKAKEFSASSLPLVAIDMGGNSIRAMAAERVGEDLFRVLGVEQSAKFPCIEHGIVANTSNAGYMIGEILRLLANRIHVAELPSAFVTIGGAGMKIAMVSAKRDKGRKCTITEEMLEEMKRECKEKIERKYPSIAVLGMVPAYFVLDGVEQDTAPAPNQQVTIIEAHFIAFYGSREIEQRLQKSFDQCGRTIEQAFARPDALLSAFACADGPDILTNGCAVLDLGAQTTTLSIYKGTAYIYNETVARGGESITKAIELQGVPRNVAEKLKCEYGCAMPQLVEKNQQLHMSVEGRPVTMTTQALAVLIEQKLDEILIPLLDKLNKEADRLTTLYVTGGGSMLYGIIEYLEQHTTLNVCYGAHDRLLTEDTDAKLYEPTYSSLIGTLLLGSEYRITHDQVIVRKETILGKYKNDLFTIFSGSEEN